MLRPSTGIIIAILFTIAIVVIAYVCADEENTNIQITRLITLPDRSEVLLESNCSINYNHIAWIFKRELKLEGDALFNIKHDKNLIVKTNYATISGSSTQFHISQHQNKLWVECYKGEVLVKTKDGELTIKKNQRLCYQPEKLFHKESLFKEDTEIYKSQSLKK